MNSETRKRVELIRRQVMLYVFQVVALVWALAVCLRTVDLGWNPFAGIGLGMFGALPISFLGIRIHSRHTHTTEVLSGPDLS
jgi:uncharacterized RDD family membrane protein YckC